MAARPARIGLLVEAELKGAHWLRMFESALAAQTRFWGGRGNVIFPLTRDLTDREMFWALADIFDADAYLAYAPTWREIEQIDAEVYHSQLSAWTEEITASVGEGEAGRFISQALGEAAFHPEVPDDQLTLISRRLAPLSFPGLEPPNLEWFDGSNPVHWPFTDISDFEILPESILSQETSGFGASRRLLHTAVHGRIPVALMDSLAARGVEFVKQPASRYDAYGRRFIRESPALPDPWSLSMAGASAFQAARLLRLPVALVVGDSPWDFALFYALLRLTGRSWWLPSWLRRDSSYRVSLETSLRFDSHHDAREVVVVSTSSVAARDRVARTLLEIEDIELEVSDWRDVLPREPITILASGTPGKARIAPLVDGSVLELDTPIPSLARTREPGEMRWLSEARGSEWAPVRSSVLGQRLLSGGAETSRTSRSGIAYFSTSSFIISGASLESVVVRPRLHPLPLAQQIQEILGSKEWRCEISDKAVYALESIDLFGGFAQLCGAILNPQIRTLIDAYRSKKGPGALLSSDRRRYLTYRNFEELLQADEARQVIEPLLDQRVITRGVVFKCVRCRQAEWHPASTSPGRFVCGRCDLEQDANREAWFGTAEPVLSYRLAEVIYQLFEHDGELPLLVAANAFGDSKNPIGKGYELRIVPPGRKAQEVDIFESDGHRLWIGEASKEPHLAPDRLEFLAELAGVIDAYGVLLGTSQPAWSEATSSTARHLFPGPWPRLRFLVDVVTRPRPVAED
jgi:hypothetical protein